MLLLFALSNRGRELLEQIEERAEAFSFRFPMLIFILDIVLEYWYLNFNIKLQFNLGFVLNFFVELF